VHTLTRVWERSRICPPRQACGRRLPLQRRRQRRRVPPARGRRLGRLRGGGPRQPLQPDGQSRDRGLRRLFRTLATAPSAPTTGGFEGMRSSRQFTVAGVVASQQLVAGTVRCKLGASLKTNFTARLSQRGMMDLRNTPLIQTSSMCCLSLKMKELETPLFLHTASLFSFQLYSTESIILLQIPSKYCQVFVEHQTKCLNLGCAPRPS
jgi:hypothetical protein